MEKRRRRKSRGKRIRDSKSQKSKRNNATNRGSKKREALENRLVVIGISLVVLALSVVVGISSKSLEQKNHEYILKEESLMKQISAEKARADQLEHQRIYVQTKQYIEKVAKEKLGLVNPDEILVKPKQEE